MDPNSFEAEKRKIEHTEMRSSENLASLNTNAGEVSQKERLKPIHIPKETIHGMEFLDALFMSSIFAGLCSAVVMLCAVLMPGGARSFIAYLDLMNCSFMGFGTIFVISYYCPVVVGSILFFLQIISGTMIGQFIVDALCAFTGADTEAVLPFRIFAIALFSFLLGILPPFSRPLYEALMESSPLQNTLSCVLLNSEIADRSGNRLTFAKALKRALFKDTSGLLYHWARFRGAQFKDEAEWLIAVSQSARIKRRNAKDRVKVSKNKMMVRYRAFHELESLLRLDQTVYKARVVAKEEKDIERGNHLALFSSFVFSNLLIVSLLRTPQFMMANSNAGSAGDSPYVLLAVFGFLGYVLSTCWPFLVGALVLIVTFVICRPTHIELTKEGVRFLGQAMPVWLRDPLLHWRDVKRIGLEIPKGAASVADQWLVFYAKDGTRRRLRVGSIDTIAAREDILRAIEKWAPDVPRDVEVIKILQAPCDYSYTELWLEALSSPPQRERLEPLLNGARLKENHYEVSGMLGCGGQGTAYRARECMTGETVVLKEFLLPVFVDVNIRRKALNNFEQEARLLKELHHPQVVTLLDYFIEDHRAYLVLEHIDGTSLSDRVKANGPFTEVEVCALAAQMCDILSYLSGHAPPVVHRDFTPDNLILTNDGRLKLIDFNVAHTEENEGTTGTVVGKMPYMAPEQFRGRPTPQSDLYSMGASLYFLLMGKEPVPISASSPALDGANCSAQLDLLIQKLTQPDAVDRISNVAELNEQLAKIESANRLLETEVCS